MMYKSIDELTFESKEQCEFYEDVIHSFKQSKLYDTNMIYDYLWMLKQYLIRYNIGSYIINDIDNILNRYDRLYVNGYKELYKKLIDDILNNVNIGNKIIEQLTQIHNEQRF